MQEVFQDYEVAPEPEDWNRIEKTLSKGKSRKILPLIIWAAAACLFLLLAVYTGGILRHSENTHSLTAVNEHKTNNTLSSANAKSAAKESSQAGSNNKSLNIKQPSEKSNKSIVNGISAVQENKTIKQEKTTNIVGQTVKVKPVEKLILATKKEELKNALIASNETKQTSPVVSKDKTTIVTADQSPEILGRSENSNLLVHAITPREIGLIKIQNKSLNYDWQELKELYFDFRNHFSGDLKEALAYNATSVKFNGLSLSNSSGMIMQSSGKEMMSYSVPFASLLTSNMYNNSVKVFNNSFLVSSNIGNLFQNNSRNYFPPVTFGLNVNLALENNWSIETGIQYTKLQSSGSISISSSSAIQFTTSFSYHVDENLYYLGVPFIINYTFSQKRKTSFYISGGISIEKGLIAKYKATPVDNFPGMEPIYSHNAISGLQFSMYSGIGISYKFIRHFELFGQPSVTNYFNSDTKNNTVYSVHPLIFNLRTGIRYTIK